MTRAVKRTCIGAFLVVLLGVLVGFVVYGWQAAQRTGNDSFITGNMKSFAAVETQYFQSHKRTFGTFEQLVNEGLLSARFSGNPTVLDDYVLTLKVTLTNAGQQSSYTLNVDPQSADTSKHHFYIDSNSADIHANDKQPASATDPSFSK